MRITTFIYPLDNVYGKVDYRGSGFYASIMESGEVFTLPVLLDDEDSDSDMSREEHARLRSKAMCLGTIFRMESR